MSFLIFQLRMMLTTLMLSVLFHQVRLLKINWQLLHPRTPELHVFQILRKHSETHKIRLGFSIAKLFVMGESRRARVHSVLCTCKVPWHRFCRNFVTQTREPNCLFCSTRTCTSIFLFLMCHADTRTYLLVLLYVGVFAMVPAMAYQLQLMVEDRTLMQQCHYNFRCK